MTIRRFTILRLSRVRVKMNSVRGLLNLLLILSATKRNWKTNLERLSKRGLKGKEGRRGKSMRKRKPKLRRKGKIGIC